MSRTTYRQRLEWLLAHFDEPIGEVETKYKKSSNGMYKMLIVWLRHYKAMKGGREAALEMYNTAMAREEAAIVKDKELKRKNRKRHIDTELAFTIVDKFLEKWDGRDPMSAGSLG